MGTKHPRETTAFALEGKDATLQAVEEWRDSGGGAALTLAQKQQILRERARALTEGTAQDGAQEETLHVIEFFLARERYAVEAPFAREVQQVKQITPLPCTPAFVLGIVNMRGRILSIVDLRTFFDLPPERSPERDAVIVFRAKGLEVGVLTDGVVGARLLPVRSIKPAAPGLSGIRREYVRGVSEDRVALLDVERILSDKRMRVGADEVEI